MAPPERASRLAELNLSAPGIARISRDARTCRVSHTVPTVCNRSQPEGQQARTAHEPSPPGKTGPGGVAALASLSP